MDFGKVDDIDSVDFTLPPDHEGTVKLLKKLKKASPQLYVGCAKWGRKDWIGKIYPKGAKESNFLDFYVQQFNSIELNATHYKMPEEVGIRKWAEKAGGRHFKFCPKFPQIISHIRRLKNAEELTTSFIKAVNNFGEHLGPCFLQLPPNYGPKNFQDLRNYIAGLPEDLEVCVELRHAEWFSDKGIFDETFGMLEEHGIGAVITDAAGRRDCVHQRLTNDTAFIRFVGNSLHRTDYSRVDDWAERIKDWTGKGVSKIYFFMHQHDELYTPEAVIYTLRQFNEKLDANLYVPPLIGEEQGKLPV
jgi:uncharacterized protein YecE (DUF72 family)